MSSPCCLYIPLLSFKAYEITLLSVYVSPLIFVRRLMKSPCCLCVPLIFSFSMRSVLYQRKVGNSSQNFLCILWDHLAVRMPRNFLRFMKLKRFPCCVCPPALFLGDELSVCALIFRILRGPCRMKESRRLVFFTQHLVVGRFAQCLWLGYCQLQCYIFKLANIWRSFGTEWICCGYWQKSSLGRCFSTFDRTSCLKRPRIFLTFWKCPIWISACIYRLSWLGSFVVFSVLLWCQFQDIACN
jgi:hypothetical protein